MMVYIYDKVIKINLREKRDNICVAEDIIIILVYILLFL